METAISAFVFGIATGSACTVAALTHANETPPKPSGRVPPPPPGNQPAKVRIFQKKTDLELDKNLITDYDGRSVQGSEVAVVVVMTEQQQQPSFAVALDDIMRGKNRLRKSGDPMANRRVVELTPFQKDIQNAYARRRGVLV